LAAVPQQDHSIAGRVVPSGNGHFVLGVEVAVDVEEFTCSTLEGGGPFTPSVQRCGN
jgi:hypothetical protein